MRSWPVLLLPALAMASLVAWLTIRPPATQELRVIEKPLSCATQPKFESLDPSRPDLVRPLPGGGLAFRGNVTVIADVCQPGTLTLTVSGEVAGGEAPMLMATVNDSEVLRQAFSAEKTVKIQVDKPGRVTLAYINDYYKLDARLAMLQLTQASGAPCETVKVTGKDRRPWSPAANARTLATKGPLTITPCQAGPMTFSLSGTAGRGEFAALKFQQAGKTIYRSTVSAEKTTATFEVSKAPLDIIMTNPYYGTSEDRNLTIRQLDFQPTK